MAKKKIDLLLDVVEEVTTEEVGSEVVLNIPPPEREDTGHGSRDFSESL